MALDGARLAILNSRLNGVARKMANTLLRDRTIRRAEPRAGLLLLHPDRGQRAHRRGGQPTDPCAERSRSDGAGDEGIPSRPSTGRRLPPQLAYHGCSHAADHTLLVPVVDENRRHRFTVLAKAHQADIGNSVPTTYHGAARDVYEEGALIFPAVQVARDARSSTTSSGCAGCESACPNNGGAISWR